MVQEYIPPHNDHLTLELYNLVYVFRLACPFFLLFSLSSSYPFFCV